MDVLCFGNLQLDVLCRTVTELPAPGSGRQIDAIDFALGGNGGNVAAVLARLGVRVELAGYVGSDLMGKQLRMMLEREGVGVEKLHSHPEAGTGTSVITIAPTGERSIIFVNGANEAFDLDQVPEQWLDGTRVVTVSSVFVLPQFTGERIARLFRKAHAAGSKTLLSICWDGEGQGPAVLSPALAHSDYFVLNHPEGKQLTGADAPDQILECLRAYTTGTVVLTLGELGCCFQTERGVERVPAVPVRAVDSTGAGDSFVGGLVAGLVRGRDLRDCAQLGARIAAYAVAGPGGYARIPRNLED